MFDEVFALELFYVKNCCVLLDFRRMFVTGVAWVEVLILVLVMLIIRDADFIVVPIVQDKVTSWLLLQW